MLDILLFVVFPYVALAIGIVGTIYRYLTNQYSFTSLSSQFLENDLQFWGSTLWHYGILPTTIIHLAGFAIPKVMAALHSTPETLYLAELAGKVLGIMALVGVGIMLYRRLYLLQNSRCHHARGLDRLESCCSGRCFFGLVLAFGYRWGATWFCIPPHPGWSRWLLSSLRRNMSQPCRLRINCISSQASCCSRSCRSADWCIS